VAVKMSFRKGIGGFLLGIVALIPFLSSAEGADTPRNRILALVNGDIITQNDLDGALKRASFDKLAESMESRRILQSLIEKKLQLQWARQRGITAEPSEVEGLVKERMRFLGFDSEERFAEELPNGGYPSLEDYREEVRNQIIIFKFIDREVRSKIVIQDQEIRDYYESHRGELRAPSEIRISRIFLPVPQNSSSGETEAVRSKMEKILSEIQQGADVSSLARMYSQGPEAARGGDLGYFKKGELSAEFEAAIASLAKGETTPIITASTGFHLLRVTDRKEGRPLSYEEARRRIEDLLFQKKYDDAYRAWFDKLRQSTYVEILP
jgi:peptidyl-prolyl cis-trans isomerase SurA